VPKPCGGRCHRRIIADYLLAKGNSRHPCHGAREGRSYEAHSEHSIATRWNTVAQAKLTHNAAKYQDHPNNGQQCSGCVQFVAPASCKVVEDPVAASGWCQLFTAKPA
jgi:hypothetical protein